MVSIFQLGQEKDTMADKLQNAYSTCETIARNASSSFFRSFRHLPIQKRQAVNALYAFCRRVDDIVDGDWLPDRDLSHLNEQAKDRSIQLTTDKQSEPLNADLDHLSKLTALLWFRTNLESIENNETVDEPIFIALADVIKKFPIELDHLRELISGMEDDLYAAKYQRFEDLRQYCYRVASTVGLCLVEIYGYNDPNARRHAVEMGIYLQMVNVLRDIQEDLSRNRIYLPSEELAKFGLTNQNLTSQDLATSEGWQNFMRHYLDHVMVHRKNAIGLLSLLDKDAKYSPSVMCAAYDAILEEAMKRNGDVFTRRLTMSLYRKIQFAFGIIRKPRLNF
ncbi:MAG: phytoene/squalene synthase family protein [Candidatus Poseidoniaceae archaeon]|nr:phytoene/squalene synthase family protein [Candidatus Poseidoniaceae archaeon]MBL6896259.1 phytoene/squalene synthase family protein [Candidatus Poseidoniaceae archaeon]